MCYKLSVRSKNNLEKVDKKLVKLVEECIKYTPYDFCITSGYRTIAEQQEMYKKGASKCDGVKNLSKHQQGLAIDIVCYNEDGLVTWEEKYYYVLSGVFKSNAKRLGIKIKWGGDFKNIVDMPHFELC